MFRWQIVSAVFFGYLAAAALLRRGVRPRDRVRVIAACAIAAALLIVSREIGPDGLAHALLLPLSLLLIGYWTSGLLFVRPMPSAERWLVSIDERLRVQAIAARMPRVLVDVLELAYVGVYALIPAALPIALHAGVTLDRFWTVIVATDCICFGMLPWVQTRPPRALGYPPPWTSAVRTLNLRLLSATSIQVNTFPSGHAAEGLAAALLTAAAPWPVAAVMAAAALAVSAGAVFGRYHYAADAIAGWLVALVVFFSFRL